MSMSGLIHVLKFAVPVVLVELVVYLWWLGFWYEQ